MTHSFSYKLKMGNYICRMHPSSIQYSQEFFQIKVFFFWSCKTKFRLILLFNWLLLSVFTDMTLLFLCYIMFYHLLLFCKSGIRLCNNNDGVSLLHVSLCEMSLIKSGPQSVSDDINVRLSFLFLLRHFGLCEPWMHISRSIFFNSRALLEYICTITSNGNFSNTSIHFGAWIRSKICKCTTQTTLATKTTNLHKQSDVIRRKK